MMAALTSPTSGRELTPDTPHSLSCISERWPVIDGIPYLRTGQDGLVRDALTLLDGGNQVRATALLLADQDDWWTGERVSSEAALKLVRNKHTLNLRQALSLLGYGRVGDYLLYRWSDPTYVAGLALMEAHWRTDCRSVFELACGGGHYLREFHRHGLAATGADVVFAKLWLARHWIVGPDVRLICFDVTAPWPVGAERFDCVACHDAFYFLKPKPAVITRMADAVSAQGWIAISHIHNQERPGYSAGEGMTSEDVARSFPDAVVYSDEELTAAFANSGPPASHPPSQLRGTEAFSVAFGPGLNREPQTVRCLFALPREGTALRLNPLYENGFVRWPSDRYRDEYAPRATYPNRSEAPDYALASAETEPFARRRELLDLPTRW